MKLSKLEQETIINFNEAERTASVYTHNEALKGRLLELCRTHPEQVRQTDANRWGGRAVNRCNKNSAVLYCSKFRLKRCA